MMQRRPGGISTILGDHHQEANGHRPLDNGTAPRPRSVLSSSFMSKPTLVAAILLGLLIVGAWAAPQSRRQQGDLQQAAADNGELKTHGDARRVGVQVP